MTTEQQIINLTEMEPRFYAAHRKQRARTYLTRTLKVNDLGLVERTIERQAFRNWWHRQYDGRDKAFIHAVIENADLREAHDPKMIRSLYILLPGGLDYRSTLAWTHWTINPQREADLPPVLGYVLPPDELYDALRRESLTLQPTDYSLN